MNQSLNANRNTGKILMYAALVLGAVLMIFPFVWMLLTSFKSAGESVQIPPTILPRQWLTDNYRRALTRPGNTRANMELVSPIFASIWYCGMIKICEGSII